MEIPMTDVVRIWRGGCIIRSTLLETFFKAYTSNPELPNLLLNADIAQLLQKKLQHMRTVVMHATQTGYPVAALMSALSESG